MAAGLAPVGMTRMGWARFRPATGRRIDKAADDFERAWKKGPRPAIEDYLAGVAEPRRSILLKSS